MRSLGKLGAQLCVLLLAAGVAAGCSSKSASSGAQSDASSPAPAASDSNAAASDNGSVASTPYPGWAAAVVPDYPNAIDQSGIGRGYQIETADDPATVVAWYKAHASGKWSMPDPDSAQTNWYLNTNGVSIQISKNTYPGPVAAARKPKTLIYLGQKK